jgi:hypothetical protein
MPRRPRRRLVEQARTWRRAKPPADMQASLERMVAQADGDARAMGALREVVLHWIAAAGDIHSARMARLVLDVGEDGYPLDPLTEGEPPCPSPT